MINLKSFIRISTKYLIISAICLITFLLSDSSAHAIAISLTCNPPTKTAVWPRNYVIARCTANLTALTAGRNYQVGIYTTNYTTTKQSGNGSNIAYNAAPENRLKVDGPVQGGPGGTPVNVTTTSTFAGEAFVKTGITGATTHSFQFDVRYTTFESDYGGTQYRQPIMANIYRNNGSLQATTASATNIDFTIDDKQYVTVSTSPTVTLTSNDVFTSNQDFDSNTFTVTVKANNTWLLNTMLEAAPNSGSYTIPVGSNYFRASGTGFSNLASAKTQFAVVNTPYNIAQNSAGVFTTGVSADNMSLSGVSILVTYTLRTTNIFTAGDYTTNSTLNLSSP